MLLTETVSWESTANRWLGSLGDFALHKLLPEQWSWGWR